MSKLYEIYCNDEEQFVVATNPTTSAIATCPNNTAHRVNTDSVRVNRESPFEFSYGETSSADTITLSSNLTQNRNLQLPDVDSSVVSTSVGCYPQQTDPDPNSRLVYYEDGTCLVKTITVGSILSNRDCQMVSVSPTAQTTSTTFVDLTDMQLTTNNSIPRNYVVNFNACVSTNTNVEVELEFILNIDGVDVLDTARQVTTFGDKKIVNLYYITVLLGDSSIIKIRWKGTRGNKIKYCNKRSLVIEGIFTPNGCNRIIIN